MWLPKAWFDVKSRTWTVSLTASLQVGIEHVLQHVRSDQVVWRVSMQALQGTLGVRAQKAALLMLIPNDLSCINTVKNWKAGLQTQRYSQLNTETIACQYEQLLWKERQESCKMLVTCMDTLKFTYAKYVNCHRLDVWYMKVMLMWVHRKAHT